MEAYSQDLRERVVEACDAGAQTHQAIASRFGVSTAWIRRLLQRRRETGSIGALPRGRGPKPKISGQRLEKLRALVEQHPDATLEELRRRMRLKCAKSTVYLALLRLGLSYKKSRSTPRSSTGRMSSKHAVAGVVVPNGSQSTALFSWTKAEPPRA
jgi:transposase